jgi:hypothetical protein
MFANASAEMQGFAQDIIKAMAPTFNDLPNTISISGHTDSIPYANNNGAYTNWELSADRANTARRVLLAGGLDSKHLLRVTGLADAVLLDPQNPINPINRRISIILLNKAAEQAVRNEGKLKTTSVEPYNKEVDQPNILPSSIPVQKAPPLIDQTKVDPPVKVQEQTVVVPKPPTSQVPAQVDKPIPSATTPSKTESKSPTFQPIQKNQIIQLEKPVPSKN